MMTGTLETVAPRNHHVEYHRVVVVDRRLVERVVAVARNVNRVGLLAQASRDESCDARVILYEQYSHLKFPRR
jgi:hypothetical protein